MSQSSYEKFNPPADYCFPGEPENDVDPYIFSAAAVIAVRVALATGRPLLVAGPPGCGKSRLAETMAAALQWNFLHQTITSRTRIDHLTVEVDHLRRLNDVHCQTGTLGSDEEYYNPGIFWWAFNHRSASRRGLAEGTAGPRCPPRSTAVVRAQENGAQHCVLLIDEIDKAEPDLPNDLLEPLDRRSFGLPDGRTLSADPAQELLTIVTTNRERELPQAFLRRCVSLLLKEPDREGLIAIAGVRAPSVDAALVGRIADKIEELRRELKDSGQRSPGTSEFLDAVNTCHALKISVDAEAWQQVEQVTLKKPMIADDERSQRP